MDTILVTQDSFDNDIEKVPKLALTVGVGTIMDSKEVLILLMDIKKLQQLNMELRCV